MTYLVLIPFFTILFMWINYEADMAYNVPILDKNRLTTDILVSLALGIIWPFAIGLLLIFGLALAIFRVLDILINLYERTIK